ncbi:hypothetical protein ACHIPZ_15690 [Antrihabitans sp. NCIMB 15449]|uniref:Uncharacterized protein n=1 Tax=Antrihabitans spumae TaxID=3373370 RepID=A0ABW7JST8_9NOCA
MILVVTWCIFAIDYLVRLAIAEQRLRWFVVHFYELAIVALTEQVAALRAELQSR